MEFKKKLKKQQQTVRRESNAICSQFINAEDFQNIKKAAHQLHFNSQKSRLLAT